LSSRFDEKDLAKFIAKVLRLEAGDEIEIRVDKLDPNRLLVVRHVRPQARGEFSSSSS